jgi:hypothetical protein
MPRALVPALLAALLLTAIPAFAGDPPKPPDAARVRAAADEFDAGRDANKQKEFERAASHFEAADAAVPSANALRQSMRARAAAGQGSRAATLAALALRLYPADEATGKLAKETLEKFEPLLHKLSVSCLSPCVLSVGTRSVHGEPSTRWTVYLDPGKETLSASFFGTASSAPREVTAKAGGAQELRFEPEEKKAAPVAPVAPVPPVKETPAKNEVPPEEVKPEDPSSHGPERKGISPAFFAVGMVATAGLGAATIWSGIDTQTNPGAAAVMAACAGKGPECPLYKQGLAKQLRTNVLIGSTAGVAAVTIVLAVFTRWRGEKKPPPVEPTAFVNDRGAVLGAAGVF